MLMNGDAEMVEPRIMMRSWGCSVALHAAVWGLCWWITSQQVMIPPSMFQWNVSLVSLSRESDTGGSSSDASMEVDNHVRPVATKSVGKPVATAPAVEPVVSETRVIRESVLSEEGTESIQSAVAVATSNGSEAVAHIDSLSRATTSIPDESNKAVDGGPQEQGGGKSGPTAIADQLADSSSLQPTHGARPTIAAAMSNSIEAKTDFSWLMNMLWGRVMELKRYPHEARMNRWEGRVVVRVVLNEQGHLLDVAIATGSGHDVLDQAALETIRRACPLSLPHALGRSQVVLRVPIQYRLDS